jgi:hypothetical protein
MDFSSASHWNVDAIIHNFSSHSSKHSFSLSLTRARKNEKIRVKPCDADVIELQIVQLLKVVHIVTPHKET